MVGAWVADSASEHRFQHNGFCRASSRLSEVRPVIPCIEVRVYIERDADASVTKIDEAGLLGQGRVEAAYSGSTAAVRAAM